MTDIAERNQAAAAPWQSRLAGALVVVLGVANLVLGVLALTTDAVRLSPATAGALLVAGGVMTAFGLLVWRGSRLATAVALTVFGLLLVVQLGDTASGGAEGSAPRVAVLIVVVAALALAVVAERRAGAGRRRDRRPTAG